MGTGPGLDWGIGDRDWGIGDRARTWIDPSPVPKRDWGQGPDWTGGIGDRGPTGLEGLGTGTGGLDWTSPGPRPQEPKIGIGSKKKFPHRDLNPGLSGESRLS